MHTAIAERHAARAPRSPAGPRDLLDPALLARLEPGERYAALASSPAGLTPDEVARRRERYGGNEPPVAERRSPLRALLAQFTHTLALLLWFAAGLAFAAAIPELGGAILAVILINGLFAFAQEYRAEQVIAALMRGMAARAFVVRDGQEHRIAASDLVPGDVVRLAAGDVAPADCVLCEASAVTLDLSMLTGETLPVERAAAAIPDAAEDGRSFELACLAPAGAAVVTGSATALVCATGSASAIGTIVTLVQSVDRSRSVLEREIAQLSRVTAVIAVLAGATTLTLLALLNQASTLTALTFATGVIVALVPEGLLPTLSVALAAGAARMAKRGAAVRRLAAVEIVGSATTICTDKTGTLTENAVSIRAVTAADGSPGCPPALIRAAALCNDARAVEGAIVGDPIDTALWRWLAESGQDVPALRARCPRIASLPFDAQRRSMSVTCDVDGEAVTYAKGAPEAIAALVAGRRLPDAVAAPIARAAEDGDRVLLLAGGPAAGPLAVLGVARFYDPPRAQVREALAACRHAGIRIVVLTGDHPTTARSVARTIGLQVDASHVLSGTEIDAMPDRALLAAIGSGANAIVARADPRQKLRIVSLLRAAGEVVAVTGDGINDAPALRAADVGIAMGLRGTEVAKQAADIVLADDNFATIVAAIEEGRAIRANIRRFVSYVFTSNVAELLPFLAYVFLEIPLPLAVIQVLAIDLGTDVIPALALGLEAPSPEAMRRPPEPPGRPLLTRTLAIRTFLVFGLIEAALGMGAWFGRYLATGWRPFASLAPYQALDRQAATLTFLGIVAGQIGCLIAQRDGRLAARLAPGGNRWIVGGLLFELAIALVLVFVPGLNRVFAMAAIPARWLLVLPAGAALFIALDVLRRAVRSDARRAV